MAHKRERTKNGVLRTFGGAGGEKRHCGKLVKLDVTAIFLSLISVATHIASYSFVTFTRNVLSCRHPFFLPIYSVLLWGVGALLGPT